MWQLATSGADSNKIAPRFVQYCSEEMSREVQKIGRKQIKRPYSYNLQDKISSLNTEAT
jgi:hypothetical protein